MKKCFSLLLLWSIGNLCLSQSNTFEFIPNAHSHNDYLKKNPLWGALENGCSSIEIDVFANKGELKVAHVGLALNVRKSFDEMYLDPLVEFLNEKSSVFQSGEELVLMIDFKTDSKTTLPLLLQSIANYKEYFSYYSEGKVYSKALKLVVSGRVFSYNQVEGMDSIYVFLDGSISSCSSNIPKDLIPRGSAKYGSHFSWKGKGDIPKEELEKLRTYIQDAKLCKKGLRFYAMPEKEAIWNLFLREGVYWINIDNSKKFKEYYLNNLQGK